MRRETLPLGDNSFLTLIPKFFIISKEEYVLMICKNCANIKSTYIIGKDISEKQYNFLQYKIRQMPRCRCPEVQVDGTDSNK